MIISNTIKKTRNIIDDFKFENKSIGFVPTMGALHEGHLSLVERCKKQNDICVVSIFVNPTQFNNKKDLDTYPRNLEKDFEMLQRIGCDMVFTPSQDEIYSDKDLNNTFDFDFKGLDLVMEGKFRPGHFNGVVQIVSKLFNIIQPDKAYFGEKDFQQVAIIRHMTQSMCFPTEIISCPIMRENSGLAMSSRNELLTEDERKKAVNISRILNESLNFASQRSPTELINWVTEQLNAISLLQVEYFEIVDGYNLRAITSWDDATYVVGCITVFCNNIRLIDNILYKE